MFIPFVFRPQVVRESVDAAGPEGRHNPSRCREAPEIVRRIPIEPQRGDTEMNRQHMCRPSGAQAFVRHLTGA